MTTGFFCYLKAEQTNTQLQMPPICCALIFNPCIKPNLSRSAPRGYTDIVRRPPGYTAPLYSTLVLNRTCHDQPPGGILISCGAPPLVLNRTCHDQPPGDILISCGAPPGMLRPCRPLFGSNNSGRINPSEYV